MEGAVTVVVPTGTAVAAGWIDGIPVVPLIILAVAVDGFEVGTVDAIVDGLATEMGTEVVILFCAAVGGTELVVFPEVSCEGVDKSKLEELISDIRHLSNTIRVI
jgi:hypothetical protein